MSQLRGRCAPNGLFVYRFEDTGPSSREDGFDSGTNAQQWSGPLWAERSEAWLSRRVPAQRVGGQQIGGSNPPVLTGKRDVG